MGRQPGHRLTLSIHLSGHPTQSWRRASPDEDYSTQSEVASQDTDIDDVDEGFTQQTQSGETSSAEDFSDTESSSEEGSVDTAPVLGSQEQFDQEVMIYYGGIDDSSLASQFLNLDDEAWPCTDQTMTTESDSLVSSSSSLSSVSAGDTLEWELEPSSLHLFDMAKFETVADFDGGEKISPWPWGDYKYRPPSPQTYLDPEAYFVEDQLNAIKNMLREELTEAMAQEAILDGKKAMKRREREERREEKERRKKRKLEREDNRPITLAFDNQMVRGRTIYNP